MRPSIALQKHREQIRAIVLAHRASNARVFGSVLYGEDTDDSDLDLLVEPTRSYCQKWCLSHQNQTAT